MTEVTLYEAARLLLTHDRYVILIHEHPDGDAVGSAEALRLALTALGKKAVIFSPDPLPRYLASFTVPPESVLPGGTYISVDVAEPSLFGAYEETLKDKVLLKLDHHYSGKDFAQYNYTDCEAAAAGEIVWELCDLLDVHSEKQSEALYLSIASDTGCFRYSNTTAKTLGIAAKLYSDGIDAAAINTILFESRDPLTVKATALGIERARFLYGGRAAVVCFTNEMRAPDGIKDEHLAELPGALRSICGVELSAVLKQDEKDPCFFLLSVRSKSFFDCSALCERLNGGGHLRASGGSVRADSPGEALKILEREIDVQWNS